MAQRKTLAEQIEAVKNELTQKENRLDELLQKKKDLERKERNHRLCKRAGHLESLLPETVTLTDEQFFMFLEKTIMTSYATKMLDAIRVQVSEISAADTTNIPAGSDGANGGKLATTQGNED